MIATLAKAYGIALIGTIIVLAIIGLAGGELPFGWTP